MRALADEIEAVLLDMDGLLFDTERLFFQAMQEVGRDAGREVPETLYRRMIGHVRDRNLEQLREHYGTDFPAEEFLEQCQGQMAVLLEDGLRLKPGVTELLDRLDQLRLPRALVTSSARESVDHLLAAFDLAGRFDAVVAYGDYRYGKPHPEPYLRAAGKLGVEPARCLALEDSHNGVRSAAGAGARTIMVPDLLEATDEMRRLCAAVLPDLHAVTALLQGRSPLS